MESLQSDQSEDRGISGQFWFPVRCNADCRWFLSSWKQGINRRNELNKFPVDCKKIHGIFLAHFRITFFWFFLAGYSQLDFFHFLCYNSQAIKNISAIPKNKKSTNFHQKSYAKRRKFCYDFVTLFLVCNFLKNYFQAGFSRLTHYRFFIIFPAIYYSLYMYLCIYVYIDVSTLIRWMYLNRCIFFYFKRRKSIFFLLK